MSAPGISSDASVADGRVDAITGYQQPAAPAIPPVGKLTRHRKTFRIVRKSAEWLEHDREVAALEAELKANLEAQVAPYPAYESFQFPRQRGLRDGDVKFLEHIHNEQHGADGCTLAEDELADAFSPSGRYNVYRALKRFRRRGMIVPTDNGKGFRIHLPLLFRRVPDPAYWPNPRTWKAYVPVDGPRETCASVV